MKKIVATVACGGSSTHVLERRSNSIDSYYNCKPFTCPHARQTAIKMTRNDIERNFQEDIIFLLNIILNTTLSWREQKKWINYL
ncbi:MAG: hypothetical protein ACLU2J_03900 [Clostridia bacterium]